MKLVEELTREPIESELPFPMAEYERRLARVRELMAARGLELLLLSHTPSLGYLTGYDTTMPPGYTTGIVPLEGDLSLHCSELEAPCMLLNGHVRDIVVFYWYEGGDTATQLGGLLRSRGYDGKRIGLEMGNAETFASGAFDTRSYLRLRELLPLLHADALTVNGRSLADNVRDARCRSRPSSTPPTWCWRSAWSRARRRSPACARRGR